MKDLRTVNREEFAQRRRARAENEKKDDRTDGLTRDGETGGLNVDRMDTHCMLELTGQERWSAGATGGGQREGTLERCHLRLLQWRIPRLHAHMNS